MTTQDILKTLKSEDCYPDGTDEELVRTLEKYLEMQKKHNGWKWFTPSIFEMQNELGRRRLELSSKIKEMKEEKKIIAI